MEPNRLEAFSDGVIAIIITIMVLELKVPHDTTLAALGQLVPVFLSYVLSFIYVGIYWNNHHHLLKACRHVNGRIMWANLHLLFWLSLVPFATGWVGNNHVAALPLAAYGVVLMMAAIAYFILQKLIVASQGPGSKLAGAIGKDFKGKFSFAMYAVAVGSAFFQPWISVAIYVILALMWMVPDCRLTNALK